MNLDLSKISSGLSPCDDKSNPAALPDDSLVFLQRFCESRTIKSVVEFGTGRSTRKFLEMGLKLFSIENSEIWLNDTVSRCPAHFMGNFSFVLKPLTLNWFNGYPIRDWTLDEEVKSRVRQADLVLVDSPYIVGYRESTLMQVLRLKPKYVIIDDARIPGVRAFCERILSQSNGLTGGYASVGHGFMVFCIADDLVVRNIPSIYDRLKGFRRFLLNR